MQFTEQKWVGHRVCYRVLEKMAALRTILTSSSCAAFRSHRSISFAVPLNAKAKSQNDPIKKLFVEKLNEFKSKGSVSNFACIIVVWCPYFYHYQLLECAFVYVPLNLFYQKMVHGLLY